MKIIQRGTSYKTFKCGCGCKFEACGTEYRIKEIDVVNFYVCNCPECGEEAKVVVF